MTAPLLRGSASGEPIEASASVTVNDPALAARLAALARPPTVAITIESRGSLDPAKREVHSVRGWVRRARDIVAWRRRRSAWDWTPAELVTTVTVPRANFSVHRAGNQTLCRGEETP